jgi:hypothetical protein
MKPREQGLTIVKVVVSVIFTIETSRPVSCIVKISPIIYIYAPSIFCIVSMSYLPYFNKYIVEFTMVFLPHRYWIWNFVFAGPNKIWKDCYIGTCTCQKRIFEGINIGLVRIVIFWNKIVSCVILSFMYGMLIPIIRIEFFINAMNSYFVICVWWYVPSEFYTLCEGRTNTIVSSVQIT